MTPPRESRRDELVGWSLWALLLIVVSGLQIAGDTRTVTKAYAIGCRGWLDGGDLYSDNGHGFLYLPITAAILSPLVIVPGPPAEIAWRIMAVAVFAAGCRVLARHIAARSGRPAFALTSAVGVLLGFSAARNGQATLPMAGFLMLAVSRATANRLPTAAVAATCALAMKPLALPVVMVVGLCRPRIVPALVLGLLGLLAAPYLCADAAWVTRQYAGFLATLGRSERMSTALQWATFFRVLHLLGVQAPHWVRLSLQLSTALAVAVGSRLAMTRLDAPRAALHVYALSILWLLLFSPRTENNTYACLAPVLAALGMLPARPGWYDILRAAACAVVGIAVVGSYEIGRVLVPGSPAVWLAPLATTLLAGLEVWTLAVDLRDASPDDGAHGAALAARG